MVQGQLHEWNILSAAGWRLRQPGCLSHSQWSKRPVDNSKHQIQALALIRGAAVFVFTNSVFREPQCRAEDKRALMLKE